MIDLQKAAVAAGKLNFDAQEITITLTAKDLKESLSTPATEGSVSVGITPDHEFSNGTKWEDIKDDAVKDDFLTSTAYMELSVPDQVLIEQMIDLQKTAVAAGNNNFAAQQIAISLTSTQLADAITAPETTTAPAPYVKKLSTTIQEESVTFSEDTAMRGSFDE